jgi:hypothetical protein
MVVRVERFGKGNHLLHLMITVLHWDDLHDKPGTGLFKK